MPLDPTIWNPSLTGPAGADGKTIHTVSGAPSDLIGVDYDYAIDSLAWVIYGPKAGGVWPAGSSLVGPAGTNGTNGVPGARGLKGDPGAAGASGAPGSVIHSGLSAPTVDIGVDGDYFFNITTADFYGPKTTGLWGVSVSLKGDQGIQGLPGVDGVDGIDGTNGTDGTPVPLAYGQLVVENNVTTIALTAAAPDTLSDNTDYIQVTGIFKAIPHGFNQEVTQATNSLTITRNGIYNIQAWAAFTSDVADTDVAFKYAVNGVVSTVLRPLAKVVTAAEVVSVSGSWFVQLAEGDVVTFWVAGSQTCNLKVVDANFFLVELLANGREIVLQNEGVPFLTNPTALNFVGNLVAASEDPANVGKIVINWDGVEVQDEGVAVLTGPVMNFVGDAVTVTEDPAGVIKIAITQPTVPTTQPYDMGFFIPGKPPADKLLFRYKFATDVDFIINMVPSTLLAVVAAGASAVFTIKKNGVSVATVTVAIAGTTGTFNTSGAPISFVAGDTIEIYSPVTQDGSLADVAITLSGTRALQ